MSNAIERVRDRLLRAARALVSAGVDYAVVGENAVAAWVSRVDEAAVRNTREVDLLLRRKDVAAAISALEAAGFNHRRVASLGRSQGLDVFLDAPDGKVHDAIHILFASERTSADQLEPNADVAQSVDTGEFQLIQLEALVRMKLSAFRDKDRMHLRDLVSVGLIDAEWLPRLGAPLRGRLQQILDTPEG